MRHAGRRVFGVVATVSAGLLAATVALWVRSYVAPDVWVTEAANGRSVARSAQGVFLHASFRSEQPVWPAEVAYLGMPPPGPRTFAEGLLGVGRTSERQSFDGFWFRYDLRWARYRTLAVLTAILPLAWVLKAVRDRLRRQPAAPPSGAAASTDVTGPHA